jgi:hypothetical protein
MIEKDETKKPGKTAKKVEIELVDVKITTHSSRVDTFVIVAAKLGKALEELSHDELFNALEELQKQNTTPGQ